MHFRSLIERTRRRKPHARPMPGIHRRSSLQPDVDMTLPYLIATDHKVWASTDDGEDAIRFAERLATVQPTRVVVTFVGIVVATFPGKGA